MNFFTSIFWNFDGIIVIVAEAEAIATLPMLLLFLFINRVPIGFYINFTRRKTAPFRKI